MLVSCSAVPISERFRAVCDPDNSNVQCFVREVRYAIVSVAVPRSVLLLDTLLWCFILYDV